MQPAENPLSMADSEAPLLAAVVDEPRAQPADPWLSSSTTTVCGWASFSRLIEQFDTILIWVNAVAFSIGLGYGLYVAVDVFRFVVREESGTVRRSGSARVVLWAVRVDADAIAVDRRGARLSDCAESQLKRGGGAEPLRAFLRHTGAVRFCGNGVSVFSADYAGRAVVLPGDGSQQHGAWALLE